MPRGSDIFAIKYNPIWGTRNAKRSEASPKGEWGKSAEIGPAAIPWAEEGGVRAEEGGVRKIRYRRGRGSV